ncbi:MAG: archaellum operon transcriptional activator EarA family protein [Nitrososphaerales archaeon]|jgi:predicted transcriptional regulator
MTLDPIEAPPIRRDTQSFSSKNEYDFPESSVVEKTEVQPDRRSRIETFFDVLCTIGSGIEKPTHIMYKANLSWTVMQLYTDSLIRKGLVLFEESEGKKRYRLTEKGRQIMQQYLSIKEDLDIISEKHR